MCDKSSQQNFIDSKSVSFFVLFLARLVLSMLNSAK